MNDDFGKLYVVSTPIGNLDDITFRALSTLKSVDLIAAEDTRHTRELLNHFDIKTSTTSFNEHTDIEKAHDLVAKLKDGMNIALVTDAGTPIISDPGVRLTKLAIDEGVEVLPIPGACAAICALVSSGIDLKVGFLFVGFIPEDTKNRKKLMENLKDETRVMIYYISSHNLKKDLKLLADTFGEDRYASLSRELTKKYEETIRGKLIDICKSEEEREPRGEYVIVVDGIDKRVLRDRDINRWMDVSIEDHLKIYIDKGFDEKEAMKKVAKDRDLKKNDIYKMLKVRS